MRSAFLLAVLFLVACAANPTGPMSGDDGGDDGGGDDGGGDDTPEQPCDVADMTLGVSTLAGCNLAGNADGDRRSARFSNPVNVERGAGEVYVADFDNGLIRAVDDDGNV